MSELKPCPFCGKQVGKVTQHTHTFVKCEKCTAKGPHVSGAKLAREAWNTRAESSSEADAMASAALIARQDAELQRLRDAAQKVVTEIDQMPPSMAAGILCNEILELKSALQQGVGR